MPAAAGKSAAARRWVASPMNAVLHETVNAWASVEADSSGAALWNVSPSTVIVGGQLAGESGVRPWRIRAVEVSTLNVDPGGDWPCSAPSTWWSGGAEPPASTFPVDPRIATIAT